MESERNNKKYAISAIKIRQENVTTIKISTLLKFPFAIDGNLALEMRNVKFFV